MRYIHIDDLELPDGWQSRAAATLNALRTEIESAAAAARGAGKDARGVAAARRTAINEGLAHPAREKLWKELAPKLAELGDGKCWYSESRNPTADKNVDHFRPKGSVAEDPNHEGYWWLAFDWRNFRFSSQWCNQRRNDKVNGTLGGKADHFPLRPGSFRAKVEGDDYGREEPMLLDPTDPDDWKLLSFRSNGEPTPSASPNSADYIRAEETITLYHLHCRELVNERRPIFGRIERIVQEMEALYPHILHPTQRNLFKGREKELIKLIRRESDYSAAAMVYARAQIYTLDRGQQMKRQWLEDILNSNP